MKKGTIIGVLLLVAACSATGAVYVFYAQARFVELNEHEASMDKIYSRLIELGSTFSNTKPEAAVNAWNNGVQPWYEAVLSRTDFFNLGEVPDKVEVPDDGFQKFFYAEKHPQLQKSLVDYAYNNRCEWVPGAFTFGVPDRYGIGDNPSREQVSQWLTTYEIGSAVTKLFIKANAAYIENVVIWPKKVTNVGSTRGAGSIESYTTGVQFRMTLQDLAEFLESLRTEDRYFTVDHIRIANRNLRDPFAYLEVSMLLTQARYSEESTAAAAAPAAGSVRSRMAGLFGGRVVLNEPSIVQQSKSSWWKRFRRKWLPF